MTPRDRFLAAARGRNVDRPPVWMMRQAGRVLPEYRTLKSKHDFWTLARTPELAAEITLMPMRRFPLDAAVIFNDILTVPSAMGMDISFGPAPTIIDPLATSADLDRLIRPAPEAYAHIADAMARVRVVLGKKRAVLGFAGAPFTLAAYMTGGGGGRGVDRTRAMMHKLPSLMGPLLERLADAVAVCLTEQVRAGADAVQIFDTWAGSLSVADYRAFVLPGLQGLMKKLEVPVIYYVNGIGHLLEATAETGADVLGIDWRVSLAEVRQRLGADRIVQGNLDPALLFASPATIRAATQAMIAATGGRGHIINLGHGLLPDTPLEGIAAFIDVVASG
ncbi:MAG: uroporphyrinogen decarboxylase [Pseudomonadota bacterium]|nr:uroporphyrinogen decarboxylase [Pseudomonadota bacterium]